MWPDSDPTRAVVPSRSVSVSHSRPTAPPDPRRALHARTLSALCCGSVDPMSGIRSVLYVGVYRCLDEDATVWLAVELHVCWIPNASSALAVLGEAQTGPTCSGRSWRLTNAPASLCGRTHGRVWRGSRVRRTRADTAVSGDEARAPDRGNGTPRASTGSGCPIRTGRAWLTRPGVSTAPWTTCLPQPLRPKPNGSSPARSQ